MLLCYSSNAPNALMLLKKQYLTICIISSKNKFSGHKFKFYTTDNGEFVRYFKLPTQSAKMQPVNSKCSLLIIYGTTK
jgi:hypothetical protein